METSKIFGISDTGISDKSKKIKKQEWRYSNLEAFNRERALKAKKNEPSTLQNKKNVSKNLLFSKNQQNEVRPDSFISEGLEQLKRSLFAVSDQKVCVDEHSCDKDFRIQVLQLHLAANNARISLLSKQIGWLWEVIYRLKFAQAISQQMDFKAVPNVSLQGSLQDNNQQSDVMGNEKQQDPFLLLDLNEGNPQPGWDL